MDLAKSNPLKVSGCANLHGHLLANISGGLSPGNFLILNSTCLNTSDLSLAVLGTKSQCYSTGIRSTLSDLITLQIDSIQCDSSISVAVIVGCVIGAIVLILAVLLVVYLQKKHHQSKPKPMPSF